MNLNCDYLCAMPSIFKMEFEIGFIETKRMNFEIRRLWFIVPTALGKSINTAPPKLLLSKIFHYSINNNNADCFKVVPIDK